MNWWYYTKNYVYNSLPGFFFRYRYKQIIEHQIAVNQELWKPRLEYYFKSNDPFTVPKEAVAIKDFRKTTGTGYYLDLKEFLHYFSPSTKFAYHFGDETHVNEYPTLFKARPIRPGNENSILFKLNKRRHFKWVDNDVPFVQKHPKIVWRGNAYQENRIRLVMKYWDHPLCDIGQTNKPPEDVPYQKQFMSISEQLQYRYILSLEGNDVATNLKWIMSSNSLCFMPRPRFETWFMEGTLQPGVHYVLIRDDYEDLPEKIEYYTRRVEEAQEIIKRANAHAATFKDRMTEDLICLKVLEKYTALSGQKMALRFE